MLTNLGQPAYLPETASQTAGPYVHIGLLPTAAGHEAGPGDLGREVASPEVPGRRVRLSGRVLDGTGAPVRDAVLELWQADAEGRHPHPRDPRGSEVHAGFRGWGRSACDARTGEWAFDTVKPGPVPGRHGRAQAPHVSLWIVARGINIGLATRLYFADEAEANAADPVLGLIDPPLRRATLIADVTEDGYRLDIRLQGEGETVFLDV